MISQNKLHVHLKNRMEISAFSYQDFINLYEPKNVREKNAARRLHTFFFDSRMSPTGARSI